MFSPEERARIQMAAYRQMLRDTCTHQVKIKEPEGIICLNCGHPIDAVRDADYLRSLHIRPD